MAHIYANPLIELQERSWVESREIVNGSPWIRLTRRDMGRMGHMGPIGGGSRMSVWFIPFILFVPSVLFPARTTVGQNGGVELIEGSAVVFREGRPGRQIRQGGHNG
jgi:hypothetical protein